MTTVGARARLFSSKVTITFMIPDDVVKESLLSRSMPLHPSPSELLCLCLRKKNYYIRYNSSNTHLVWAINLCLHYSSANSVAMLAAHTLYSGVWCIFHRAGVWQNGVGKWGSSFITVLVDCSRELPKVAWNGGNGAGEMERRKRKKKHERDKLYQTSASNFSARFWSR